MSCKYQLRTTPPLVFRLTPFYLDLFHTSVASEISSPAASVAGTPSPEPSTPPTSPAKSTPPSSPSKRQTAAAAKKEETRKAKEIEKAKKWRGVQRGKVEKVSLLPMYVYSFVHVHCSRLRLGHREKGSRRQGHPRQALYCLGCRRTRRVPDPAPRS
jgi:type IV secretory pathway VirB10-like protein